MEEQYVYVILQYVVDTDHEPRLIRAYKTSPEALEFCASKNAAEDPDHPHFVWCFQKVGLK